MFKPSLQQKAAYIWIEHGTGSAVIRAVAGAGKTTTLIEALKLMTGSVFFGAYNKKIAEEITARAVARPGLNISTMHAAGFKTWRQFAKNVQLDDKKCRNIFRAACQRYPQYTPFEDPVLLLVSLAKQAAFGVECQATRADWENLVNHFSIDTLEEEDLVLKLASKVLSASIEQDHQVIDFDDMIYAPLIHNSRFWQYDWVLIDEAQDTNAARRLMALRMLKPTGRLIAVGDEHQAIYGFTGADSNALDLIKAATKACDLPLTKSYRCPQAVVKEAHKYVSHIEALDTAPMGSVTTLTAELLRTTVKVGDAVLCRFNAPLIKEAYAFIAAGIPARVEGREIGEGLKKLASRWKSKSLTILLDNLAVYEEREVAKATAKEQTKRIETITDSVACLRVIIGRVQASGAEGNPVQLVSAEIDKIFGEDVSKTPHVLLSTIHKSKGREWHRVIWLQTGPSKYAKLAWEQEQEVNLCYVAVTRAKSELILVDITEIQQGQGPQSLTA